MTTIKTMECKTKKNLKKKQKININFVWEKKQWLREVDVIKCNKDKQLCCRCLLSAGCFCLKVAENIDKVKVTLTILAKEINANISHLFFL